MGLKQKITQARIGHQCRLYEEELQKQKDRYGMWIHANEKKGRVDKIRKDTAKSQFGGLTIETLTYGEMDKAFASRADLILFTDGQGKLAHGAKEKIAHAFLEDGNVRLVYGDEDCICLDGRRGYPWFKPDFSPDTLLGFFYFGSCFALRRQDLSEIVPLKDGTDLERIYDLVLKLVDLNKGGVCHIRSVLYHRMRQDLLNGTDLEGVTFSKESEYGFEERFDGIKQQFLKRNDMQGQLENCMDAEGKLLPYRVIRYACKDKPLVSVIIPSKDHPDVLERCIHSLREKTTYDNYEIIVMDNGSTEENKSVIEKLAEKERFYYHYEAMEFNFSRMCNIGVSLSKGEYVLLLNDDMEVIRGDWMETMLGQAALSKCGAVGAKLLYPDTDEIQHVGITNMGVGPSHKLIHFCDREDYYYGRNHLVYNVVGVTAACLMVKRSIYDEVGGMPEEIQVAYNDAEFCMRVYEAGYYNVIRNDVILYHHESLSRGDDRMDEEKLRRLLKEKEAVRKLHPDNMENDPFYSPNLAGYRVPYDCSFRYGYEKREVLNNFRKLQADTFEKWENNCLTIYLDHADVEAKTDVRDETDIILIEGWSYVLGMDNCRYRRFIILTGENGESFGFTVADRYRKDVAEILPKEKNVELAGFVVRFPKSVLGTGTWQIAMLAKDICSRQKLYKKCNEVLTIL